VRLAADYGHSHEGLVFVTIPEAACAGEGGGQSRSVVTIKI